MEDNILAKLDEQVKKNNVMVYMKGTPNLPQCGFSAHTVEILKSYGYPFETVDVLTDPAVREGIKQYSNWPTIPQVFIKGKLVGGCDILHELHERGELASLL
ncbi:MAG: Grx4 family monothiol glutaredoxin, partial [Candidatus Binatia bacterium]